LALGQLGLPVGQSEGIASDPDLFTADGDLLVVVSEILAPPLRLRGISLLFSCNDLV